MKNIFKIITGLSLISLLAIPFATFGASEANIGLEVTAESQAVIDIGESTIVFPDITNNTLGSSPEVKLFNFNVYTTDATANVQLSASPTKFDKGAYLELDPLPPGTSGDEDTRIYYKLAYVPCGGYVTTYTDLTSTAKQVNSMIIDHADAQLGECQAAGGILKATRLPITGYTPLGGKYTGTVEFWVTDV